MSMEMESLARELGLPREGPACQYAVTEYVNTTAQDERRPLWLLETLGNALALEVVEYQTKLARLASFPSINQDAEVETREYLARAEQDFRFVNSLYRLAQAEAVERSAAGIAQALRGKMPSRPKKKD